MKSKITTLAITSLALSGCTHFKNLAAPLRSYAGIKTSAPWDSIRTGTDAFAARYGWNRIDTASSSVTYANVYFYNVSLGETCQLKFYMSNDSLHAKLNPCATFDEDRRKWGRMEDALNDGLRQSFLTQAYYKAVDPRNPSADSLLKSNSFPKITTKADIEKKKTGMFDIIDKYITD